jgi:hypothetical protein
MISPTDGYKVGDKVTVIYDGGLRRGPQYMGTIKRLMSRFLELEDGTKWAYGKPYPRTNPKWSGSQRIELATPAHVRAMFIRDMQRYLSKLDLNQLRDPELDALARVVRFEWSPPSASP